MTPTPNQLLAYITQHVIDHGWSPSDDEMRRRFFVTKAELAPALKELVKQGAIEISGEGKRRIKLL